MSRPGRPDTSVTDELSTQIEPHVFQHRTVWIHHFIQDASLLELSAVLLEPRKLEERVRFKDRKRVCLDVSCGLILKNLKAIIQCIR